MEKVMAQGKYNLAGPVKVISESYYPEQFKRPLSAPGRIPEDLRGHGLETVAALQLRNPMHRSHEFLAKIAVEVMDGVYIHQLVGKLKAGDIPADVRVKAIEALVDNYFVKGTVVQGGYPMEMRYAGPREALLHAVFRQNYGCSHMIIGRDHAGVGDYYGPFDAQKIFDEIPEGGAEVQEPEHRLDLLLLQVRRHGLHEDLPPRQGGPAAPLGHHGAQDAFPRAASCRRSSPGPRSWRSCRTTTRTWKKRWRSSCTARPPAK